MATSSSTVPTSQPAPFYATARERLKPFLAPYYLTVAAVLGAITVGFVVLFALMVLVVNNFNVLDWME